MLVVIAFHRGDYDQATNLISWMTELGPCATHSCLLIAASDVSEYEYRVLHASAKKCFPTVQVIVPSQNKQGWPAGPNLMFQTALTWIAKFPQPFFWCEPDCIPLKKGWLDVLETEYIRANKPFMGTIFDNPKRHLNGCAIYPANVKRYNPYMVVATGTPFDVVRPELTLAQSHVTILIHHVWGDIANNIPPVFPSYSSLSSIRPEAVVFHRCKDGSLINRLRELKHYSSSKSWLQTFKSKFHRNGEHEVSVVITNCRRPLFLKEAFRSAVEAGASHIVVSSSSATPEIELIHKEFKKVYKSSKIVSERTDSGCNQNWLAGVKAAKSKWVTILHDDDLLLPQFKMVEEEIDDSIGFLLWDARRHGMGYNDGYKALERPGGVYPTKDLLRNLMIKGSFTFSPVIGCFRKVDLLEALTEAKANFKEGFHLKPTMMVGNDLLIWLKAIRKYRYFKYIDQPLTSFGHHPESTTCDDVFNQRGRLGGIYNLTRAYFMEKHPKILHVVSRYNPGDEDTRRRVNYAAQSWATLYATGLVEPVHVWNTSRDSMGVGDDRRTHFLKDVLRAGMDKARDFDYVMFTNDDSVLHPDLPFYLLDFMLETECCCAFRRSYSSGSQPHLAHRPKHPVETPGHDPGRDLFCFSKKWLLQHWESIPDYLLGATDFDSTLATLIRISKNIPVSDKTWLTYEPRCEIPSWFVFHETHNANWSTPENRKNIPSNVFNRRLTFEFIKKHDNGWFVDFGKSGTCETFTTSNLIPLIAHLDPASGYGATAVELTSALLDLGFSVDLYQGSKWDTFDELPLKVRSCVRQNSVVVPWNLVIFPCIFQPSFLEMNTDNRTAWFSMWETTSLCHEGMNTGGTLIRGVSFLNKCVVAIVPCRWNEQVFKNSGVKIPIRMCPLGIDPEMFPLIENDPRGTLVFGTAARTSVGGVRKGIGIVTEAFIKAFPEEQDVRLRVKCFPDDTIGSTRDPRIEFLAQNLTRPELVEWYKSLNVFVSGSASEGWGRHQQESMSMGRPIISINAGGVAEFFTSDNGYAVKHTTVPAEGIYTGMGHYFRPDVESITEQMRRAYEDRNEIVRKGELAAKSARKFTMEHSARTLVNILKEFRFL